MLCNGSKGLSSDIVCPLTFASVGEKPNKAYELSSDGQYGGVVVVNTGALGVGDGVAVPLAVGVDVGVDDGTGVGVQVNAQPAL